MQQLHQGTRVLRALAAHHTLEQGRTVLMSHGRGQKVDKGGEGERVSEGIESECRQASRVLHHPRTPRLHVFLNTMARPGSESTWKLVTWTEAPRSSRRAAAW